MRIGTDATSARACAEQVLNACPQRLRPPPLASRSAPSFARQEVSGRTYDQPRHAGFPCSVTSIADTSNGCNQMIFHFATNSPPKPNCMRPSAARHQRIRHRIRWAIRHATPRAITQKVRMLPVPQLLMKQTANSHVRQRPAPAHRTDIERVSLALTSTATVGREPECRIPSTIRTVVSTQAISLPPPFESQHEHYQLPGLSSGTITFYSSPLLTGIRVELKREVEGAGVLRHIEPSRTQRFTCWLEPQKHRDSYRSMSTDRPSEAGARSAQLPPYIRTIREDPLTTHRPTPRPFPIPRRQPHENDHK